MKSIIEEIYYCKRGTTYNLKLSDKYNRTHDEYCNAFQKLREHIDEKSERELLIIDSLVGELLEANTFDGYAEGFKVGLLTGLEIFGEK